MQWRGTAKGTTKGTAKELNEWIKWSVTIHGVIDGKIGVIDGNNSVSDGKNYKSRNKNHLANLLKSDIMAARGLNDLI